MVAFSIATFATLQFTIFGMLSGLSDVRDVSLEDDLTITSVIQETSVSSCVRDCTRTTEKKTCVFRFILEQLKSNTPGRLADGHDRYVLVYNGKLPGPTITVCEGDDVVVNLINNLGEGDSTTLHFHGIREKQKSTRHVGYSEGGPWSDGVPLVTQCPIPACPSPTPTSYIPESCVFTHKFLGSGSIDAPYNNAPAGTYWYHSHVGRQRMNGAAGKLIIMPRQKRSDVDIDDPDNSLFLQEWYKNTTNEIPTGLLVNGKGKQSRTVYQCTGIDCITKYKEGNSVAFTTVPNLDYGPTSDYEVFHVNPDKSYRFRIIGGIGDDHPIRISVENHVFTAIAADSIDIKPVHNLDALWISAGERYDIVIKTKTNPKRGEAYKINVFSNRQVTLCTLAWLKYPQQYVNNGYEAVCAEMEREHFTKVLNPVPDKFNEWNNPSKYIYPKDLRALVQANNVQSSLNTQYISMPGLTFNEFSMKYPDIPFLFQSPSDSYNRCGVKCSPTYRGRTLSTVCNTTLPSHGHCGTVFPPNTKCECQHVIQQPWSNIGHFEIILINGNGTAHPIHHHGGWFNIVGMGQFDHTISRDEIIRVDRNGRLPRNFVKPVFKDTIQVPTNGYVIFRAPIDNSGAWIVHCHINYHIEHGMAMVFQIGEPDGPHKWSMGPDQATATANKNHNCF